MTREQMREAAKTLRSVKSLLVFRDVMSQQSDFDRSYFNQLIRAQMRENAEYRDARFYAHDKCLTSGHIWHIANGYQSLWDNGADVPSQCARCGEIEM